MPQRKCMTTLVRLNKERLETGRYWSLKIARMINRHYRLMKRSDRDRKRPRLLKNKS